MFCMPVAFVLHGGKHSINNPRRVVSILQEKTGCNKTFRFIKCHCITLPQTHIIVYTFEELILQSNIIVVNLSYVYTAHIASLHNIVYLYNTTSSYVPSIASLFDD